MNYLRGSGSDFLLTIGEDGIEDTLKQKAVSNLSFSGGECCTVATPEKSLYA